jgi:3-hydroxyisobutyrate dehydrogenase-like beta-hydroxyacid dehydrogenase
VTNDGQQQRIGWIGVGRMGLAMCERLLDAGHTLTVWNRTPDKAAPLVERGATLVGSPAELAGCDVVFSIVSDDDGLRAVTSGDGGLFTGPTGPAVLVESSTVSAVVSEEVTAAGGKVGTAVLAAPVSGNPSVVRSGDLACVASGPRDAFDRVEPLLTTIARTAVWAGPGTEARLVKLCHNVLVAVIVQALAEALVLAEKHGVPRRAVMDFMNSSVHSSRFLTSKTAALADLDFTTAFTAYGQRKDLRLAMEAARTVEVSMPVTVQTEQALTRLIGSGLDQGRDFSTLLLLAAHDAGLELES